jgi:excisionase family DNA binding protein
MTSPEFEQLHSLLTQVIKKVDAMSASNPTTEWISTREACRLLRCGNTKLYQLRQTNSIRTTADGTKGKPVLYSRTSILQFLDAQTIKNRRVKV